MKLSVLLAASVASALPFNVFNYFYKRDPLIPVLLKAGNSTSANGTNGTATNGTATNGSNGSASEIANIRVFGFSENFTTLWGGESPLGNSSISLNVSVSQIAEALDLSGNATNTTLLSQALSLVSLSAILNSSGIKDIAILHYEQLDESFNDTSLPILAQALSDDEEEFDSFIVVLNASQIESAAFFVDAVVYPDYPVVFTIEPKLDDSILDGLSNLYNSVIVAADEENSFGSQIVSDGSVGSAFYAVRHGDSFKHGSLGRVYKGEAQWLYDDVSFPSFGGNFSISDEGDFPVVTILSSDSVEVIQALSGSSIEGIVLSSQSIDDYSDEFISSLSDVGVPVVFASSAGDIINPEDVPLDGAYAAGLLPPAKAKALLEAALASNLDGDAISEVFSVVYGG